MESFFSFQMNVGFCMKVEDLVKNLRQALLKIAWSINIIFVLFSFKSLFLLFPFVIRKLSYCPSPSRCLLDLVRENLGVSLDQTTTLSTNCLVLTRSFYFASGFFSSFFCMVDIFGHVEILTTSCIGNSRHIFLKGLSFRRLTFHWSLFLAL